MRIRQWVPAFVLLPLVLLLPAFRWTDVLNVPPALPERGSVVSAALPERGSVVSVERDGMRYHLYTPSSLEDGKSPTVLVTLAGFGGNARDYLQQFIPYAEQNEWVLLSPQLASSGAWQDVEVIRSDARRNLGWLCGLVKSLQASPSRVGGRLLLYGFSLGSQNAHRFTLAYPRHVTAAALMAAGTYTLPAVTSPGDQDLLFPFGAGDLERYSGEPFDESQLRSVPFWIGVGGKDNLPGDVPRDWDRLVGSSRLERAGSFARAIKGLGARTEMAVFAGQGHSESGESLASAMGFLRRAELAGPSR